MNNDRTSKQINEHPKRHYYLLYIDKNYNEIKGALHLNVNWQGKLNTWLEIQIGIEIFLLFINNWEREKANMQSRLARLSSIWINIYSVRTDQENPLLSYFDDIMC